MNIKYRYSYQQNKKYLCPNCDRKTFVRYLDHSTNKLIPDDYGKCDRADKCNYHVNPYTDGYAKKIEDEDSIRNSNRVKVILDKNSDAIYFSRFGIPFSREDVSTPHFKHIGIYAWRLDTLKELLKLESCDLEKSESLEQLRWMFNGSRLRVAETTIETPNIDTPEDLEEVLSILNNQNQYLRTKLDNYGRKRR